MYIKWQVFYVTLITIFGSVLLNPSDLYDYAIYDISEESEEVPPAKKVEVVEVPTLYETAQIFADKGSDVVLKCSPEYEKATWLLTPGSDLSITSTSDGVSSLSIRNLTHDHTYECRRSDNIVKRFILSINGQYAKILSDSSNFVKNGTNIRLSCVLRSIVPVTSAFLRVDDTSQKYMANWESKRRICENNDYNRTDCAEETTFQFNVDVTDNAIYFCGSENVESLGHSVEVLKNEPIIYEATQACALRYVQRKIVEFTIEALEKHGFSQDAAADIRRNCIAVFKKRWPYKIQTKTIRTKKIRTKKSRRYKIRTVQNPEFFSGLNQEFLIFFLLRKQN